MKNLEGYLGTFTGAYDVEKQQDSWLPILWNLLIEVLQRYTPSLLNRLQRLHIYISLSMATTSNSTPLRVSRRRRQRRLVTVNIFKIYLLVERTTS